MDKTEALLQALERAKSTGYPVFVAALVGATNQFDIFDTARLNPEKYSLIFTANPDGSHTPWGIGQTPAATTPAAGQTRTPPYVVIVCRHAVNGPDANTTSYYRAFGPFGKQEDAATLVIRLADDRAVVEAHIVPIDRLGTYIEEHPEASTNPTRLGALVRFMKMFGPPFVIGLSETPQKAPKTSENLWGSTLDALPSEMREERQ